MDVDDEVKTEFHIPVPPPPPPFVSIHEITGDRHGDRYG
ncbi:unnamed protein product, partial [marine sediment metagenome]